MIRRLLRIANSTLRAMSFAAAALAVSSCSTIHNATIAKEEVAESAVPSGASRLPRVNLVGYELPDFVEFAMTNRPEVVSALLSVEERLMAIRMVESGKPFMPNLTASARYGQSTQNNGSHFSWRNNGRFSGGVSFEMLLLDFGRYDASFKAAVEDLVAAEATLGETRLGVFEDVAKSYFTLLMNDALLDVARTNEWGCIHHLSQATNRFANGEAKLLDVLRAKLDLSEAVQARISASNSTVTAAAGFLQSLGLSVDRATREDVLAVAKDGLGTALKEFEKSAFTAEEALIYARTNSPALMAKRAQLRAAVNDVDWAVADLFPELSVSSSFNFADPAWNWSWAFEAAQSLFLGWRKTTAVDAAVVRMRSAKMDLESAELSLSRDIAVAISDRDDSAASLEAARTSVRQARENLRVTDEQYRVGDASRIDYADAVADYAAALGQRVKAFYEGQLAEARIVRLVGLAPLYYHEVVCESGE